ncbi:hypothetical protein IAQ61_000855 [Plenodomus lingam]|uniref:uncharacterized protein n=1 Tax=Leptosphaeria maculans TaxID=5022 RepID=UPI00333085F2|nr:hypothetical protein IAQ61_000855 [Plenodomus lingam]
MKLFETLALFALATQITSSTSIPDPAPADLLSPSHALARRKGGGGRGGSSSGGSSTGGGSRGGSSSRTSSSSNAGGATRSGSGPARSFGSGRYYGGGAAVPYSAGARTPRGLVAGALIAPLVLVSLMPGLWLYNCYPYYYNNPYRFYNASANDNDDDDNNTNKRRLIIRQTTQQPTGQNQSLPVLCLCQESFVCSCDENEDQQYLADLIGNGSYAALNKSLATVSDINGTRTLVLNGTLPKGTTAPGGEDDVEGGVGRITGAGWVGWVGVAVGVTWGVLM